MKVFLETMGCQMNKLDSELAVGQLRAAGHEMVDDAHLAEVILYNTCSVRQHAENKVHSRLGHQTRRKAAGKRVIVGVLGCMAQKEGQSLLDRYAGVDFVIGPSELDRLAEMVAEAEQAQDNGCHGRGVQRPCLTAPDRPRRGRQRDEADNERLEDFDLSRAGAGENGFQAYVRVQRGCDKFCSYCVVPYVRGSEQSRNPSKIEQEVRRLVDAGCKEVTLLGQTVNSYAWRDGGATVGLADLLERLNGVAGIERIRFVTSYPAEFDRRILQAMRDLPKVCEYLHVPAQSGSDKVLAAMGRRYTAAEYVELVDEARATVPGVAIAGDFIVGFPGETDEDFAASVELVRRAGYKNSFIFQYSPRPGTRAATHLVDDVPSEMKRRRNNELLAVQNEVSLAHNQALIGTTQQILVEGKSVRADKQPRDLPDGHVQLVGRTRGDHIVVVDGPPSLAGQLVNVQIQSCTALALNGIADSRGATATATP